MSDKSGKVVLALENKMLENRAGSTPRKCELSGVIDFVGHRTASQAEGDAPVHEPSKSTSAQRRGEGCIDTDNNRVDFEVCAPDQPFATDALPVPAHLRLHVSLSSYALHTASCTCSGTRLKTTASHLNGQLYLDAASD